MAREKVDNKLNVVIGTKAQVLDDTTIPDNSIVIVTDEELNVDSVNGKVGAVVLTQDDVSDGTTYKRYSATDKTRVAGMFGDNYFKGVALNETTYVMTFTRRDGTAVTVDLPLESVVVSGAYNNTTQKVVLTLVNGSTIEFSVADLVSGLVSSPTISKGEVSNKTLTLGGTFKVLYVSTDGTISERVLTLPSDSPEDGKLYARKDANWVEISNDIGTWELLGARTSVGSISFSTSGLTELRVICYPNLPEEPEDNIDYLGDEKTFTIDKLFKYKQSSAFPSKDATSGVALTIFNGATAITVKFNARRLGGSNVSGLPTGNLFTFEVYGR